MHLLNVTSSLVFVCFCIFCGLLHSGFVFNKTETWFWYSKIKIQPCQKLYLCTGDHFFHTRGGCLIHFWRKSFDFILIHLKNTKVDRNLDPSFLMLNVQTLNWFISIQHFESTCDYLSIISVKSTGFLWYLYDISVKLRKK